MVFVQVNLYIMDSENGQWSAPIPGWGGDYLIKKDKNGIHGNDEAMKMATTDALGTAAKMIGVAADVYRGLIANGASDSKYARRDYATQATQPTQDNMRAKAMHSLNEAIKKAGVKGEEVSAIAGVKYGKTSTKDMTTGEICDLANNLPKYVQELADGK
jgi:hypothetical protein